MRNLVYTLLIQTRRTAPYSGSCAQEVATAGQKLTCTVVYDGLEVPFEVTLTSGSPLYQYTAAQKKFVLTREAVRYQWWETMRELSRLACDSGVPDVMLTDMSAATPYICTAERNGRVEGWKVGVFRGRLGFDPAK